tara:strand:- start:128 stop:322 length:195 start_codon:yes stop_codon:yes gene_type:complete
MAAIITDQLRILNAKNFVAGVQSSSNSYYTFIGLPNATDYSSTWESHLHLQEIVLISQMIIGTQ